MKTSWKWPAAITTLTGLLFAGACTPNPTGNAPAGGAIPTDVMSVARERGLTPDDLYAAAKTYMPSGKHDDYVLFASGGHSGQVHVIGVPSMRLLKTIAVFTPEPWQGYGYGGGPSEVLKKGNMPSGKELTWGDTHHPNLSETKGSYDGRFLFINDKANARLAVIDLRDFETKQIIKNPNAISDHGGSFVTPNTEYVVEGPQYATPIGWEYSDIKNYKEKYRALLTFWKFDPLAGRINVAQSFQMELPPYFQDLADAGKGASDGLVFVNSFNTEMATGGIEKGEPPFEAGASKNDVDYLHIIDWRKAAQIAKSGPTRTVNGMKIIGLDTAVKEKLLYFTPEPKSPHGVDVTPSGESIVVGGKLDPHVTVYSTAKIRAAMAKGSQNKDPFGVPILSLDDTKEAQVELGLGPLHTVFDNQGYAYTSMFLDSAVARWTLGGADKGQHPEPDWTLVQKLPVHYNIGHIASIEGDTATPGQGYVVALNKWSTDRFLNLGPLLPQNFQLVDSARPGESMKVLYDSPIGVAEPHYAQLMRADRLKPYEVYPFVGFNPETGQKDPNAVLSPKDARIVRKGKVVEIFTPVIRSHFSPEHVTVNEGDTVIWHLTNIERTRDAIHGFCIGGYNINLSLEPGEHQTVTFKADQPGVFPFYCTEFCSALHLEMMGYFMVKPR
ncbi:MAG: Sec-dependent nitrous-oxide reductase [Candidatus Eremiobacteraeota bacterium]|nr:Sec-dependent nitrous-oxide reductase [Candidatus Eremiobacteraeota bacterium]MCW5869897.1 Sec-dependent nitrous-oxide reductase [Candidatus Eremiobacteraeota bacterium]